MWFAQFLVVLAAFALGSEVYAAPHVRFGFVLFDVCAIMLGSFAVTRIQQRAEPLDSPTVRAALYCLREYWEKAR